MAVGFNFAIPGLGNVGTGGFGIPLPSLNSSATSGMDQHGMAQSASGPGDWSVNLGGSGLSMQSASGGMNWLLIAAAVGAVWLLRK